MSIFDDLTINNTPDTSVEATNRDFHTEYQDFINRAVRERMEALYGDASFSTDAADQRFSTSLNLARVRSLSVAIIGCGGLGNWQWRVILGMGFRNVHVFDDDVVSIENIGPQAHSMADLGLPKVEAVRRAALMYRGVSITAHNRRVRVLSDITEAMGSVPDIVIGCTDSASFRNGFIGDDIHGLVNNTLADNAANLPLIFLDYRMSLGDWVCYAIPSRHLRQLENMRISGGCLEKYTREAIFPEESAVQEPCTARAICYTGAHAASFTGAFLHWFLSMQGTDYLYDYFMGNGKTPFAWKTSYSAKDWESITNTPRELLLRRRIEDLTRKDSLFSPADKAVMHRIAKLSGNDYLIPVRHEDELPDSQYGRIHYVMDNRQEYFLLQFGDFQTYVYYDGSKISRSNHCRVVLPPNDCYIPVVPRRGKSSGLHSALLFATPGEKIAVVCGDIRRGASDLEIDQVYSLSYSEEEDALYLELYSVSGELICRSQLEACKYLICGYENMFYAGGVRHLDSAEAVEKAMNSSRPFKEEAFAINVRHLHLLGLSFSAKKEEGNADHKAAPAVRRVINVPEVGSTIVAVVGNEEYRGTVLEVTGMTVRAYIEAAGRELWIPRMATFYEA